jgi:hypothetical protein
MFIFLSFAKKKAKKNEKKERRLSSSPQPPLLLVLPLSVLSSCCWRRQQLGGVSRSGQRVRILSPVLVFSNWKLADRRDGAALTCNTAMFAVFASPTSAYSHSWILLGADMLY